MHHPMVSIADSMPTFHFDFRYSIDQTNEQVATISWKRKRNCASLNWAFRQLTLDSITSWFKEISHELETYFDRDCGNFSSHCSPPEIFIKNASRCFTFIIRRFTKKAEGFKGRHSEKRIMSFYSPASETVKWKRKCSSKHLQCIILMP